MNSIERPNRKIRKIILNNFQNHKHSTIELSDGLNLIVGSSDSGKTAIARALHYVLNDSYGGNHFVCHGEKFFDVRIEFEDGAIIRRIKSKDINRVEYKYPDEPDFNIRTSFDKKYPDDVIQFLNNPPYSDELGFLSYSDQSNKNFLLDLSPSALPRAISSIVGVDDLEKASSDLSSKVLEISKSIKSTENEIKSLESQLENNYINLDDDITEIDLVKKIISDSSTIEINIINLKSLHKNFKRIDSNGFNVKVELDKSKKIIESLESELNEIPTIQENVADMIHLNSNINSVDLKISKTNKIINFYKLVLDGEYKKILDEIEKISNNLETMKEFHPKYESYIKKNKLISDELDILTSNFDQKTIEFDNLKAEIKEKNIACSSCNKIGGESL